MKKILVLLRGLLKMRIDIEFCPVTLLHISEYGDFYVVCPPEAHVLKTWLPVKHC
jgi:hypothetical protein